MSNIDPSNVQFEVFKGLPRDAPMMMLNLIRLNQVANYEGKTSSSGHDAYETYATQSASIFKGVGGEIIWRGRPESVLIGPSDEHWDIAFIARYPNAGSFLAMVTDPNYQAIVFHRQAAVKDSRLIRMGSLDGQPAMFG